MSKTGLGAVTEVPDLVEPIRAYRYWLIWDAVYSPIIRARHPDVPDTAWIGSTGILGKYGGSVYVWDTEKNIQTVECRARPIQCPQPHYAPHSGCTCGFYAVPSWTALAIHIMGRPHPTYPDLWPNSGPMRKLTFGEVELSGRVVIHENGYRAEQVKIIRAYADSTAVPELDVPFELIRTEHLRSQLIQLTNEQNESVGNRLSVTA